jgi:glycosyltransferase involved in cell wall biosynthesis
MNRKKRILMASEASYTMSGFGTYYFEVMDRLHKTGKYDLAEFASYGFVNDPRDMKIKWPIYANAVKDDDPRAREYHSGHQQQFGSWRFDKVLLDFKPDIVMDIRDPWMLEWQKDSQLRQFFHLVWMPTVDSSPQQEGWIDAFARADGIFTYSDWGLEVLRKEGGGKIKLQCAAPSGTDLNIFKPAQNKQKHRQAMGLPPDINIIGTVMRNQRRKLYPDLFEAFKIFLDKCAEQGLDELANKTFLFIHTSYPDNGWNIPLLLKQYEISHKVIFSYVCRTCNQWFASRFHDAATVCPACGNYSAVLPNVSFGVQPEQLANIFKCFDLYVQYAICEGLGMPQVEAAACGVPLASVDYSAMEDVIRKTGGIPLPVKKMFLEMETQAYRAYPDNDACADLFIKFFQKSFHEKQKMGFQSRLAAERHYNWDNTAKIWEAYFDSVVLKGNQGKWNAPPVLYNVPDKIPDNLSNEQFVDWIFNDVLSKPELRYSLDGLKIVTALNLGITLEGGIRPVDKNNIFQQFRNRAVYNNTTEKYRCGLLNPVFLEEDFIKYAKLKADALKIQDGDIIS